MDITDSSIYESVSVLNVSVDKRITLGAFKCHLEAYVGVVSNLFKVSVMDVLDYLEQGYP